LKAEVAILGLPVFAKQYLLKGKIANNLGQLCSAALLRRAYGTELKAKMRTKSFLRKHQ